MTELEIAAAIASGTMPSPTVFCGNTFFACRFSGTGVAWRESIKEFAWRDPAIWLSEEMQRRVVGVPLISDHPDKGLMDGADFYARVVGVTVFGFVKPAESELWAVARVVDKDAAKIIDSGGFDTSPAVTFEPGENQCIDIDGDQLLIEGDPKFIDHLALIDTRTGNAGVWSKGEADAIAVETTETATA